MTEPRILTVYIDLKSPYAYLAKDPAYELERDFQIRLDWLPYVLDISSFLGTARLDEDGHLIEESRNAHQWRRVKYSYMDCRRQARKRGLVIRGTTKIWDTTLVSAAMLWAKPQGDAVLRRYLDLTFERFWKRELDIEDTGVVTAVLAETGATTAGFGAYAANEGPSEVARIGRDAEKKGVFGVPSFILDGELFWGREHLAEIRDMLGQLASSKGVVMSITIRPLHPTFVGEVAGVDCRHALTPDEVAAIELGMDRYAVLVFREQFITDDEQLAFTRHFGELESYRTPGHIRRPDEQRLGPGMADFSNLDKDGNIIPADDRVWFFKLADRLWHSDSSFRPVPAKYSLLSARVLPSWGGNTEFADMRAAYDGLHAREQIEIEDLVCLHSLIYSRAAIGFAELAPEETAAFRPVRQRLVRTHPVTGRKSLFLSAHAGAIEGWTVPESRMLLRDLIDHATQPDFVYSHAWRPGDIVMWDNRQTMHRARRFDDRHEIRDMRRTTLAGDVATIEETA